MGTNRHILIAEDEPKIAELLATYLAAAGYRSQQAADGEAALAAIAAQRPDLLLLDLMLPKLDGLAVCRAVRRDDPDLPIIVLTARVQEADRLLGLDLGADDYVCKPFSPREVVARVKALLRRSERRTMDEAPGTAPFELDEAAHRISLNGKLLSLTSSEYRLLREFIAHPGRVYSRDQLLDVMHEDLRDVGDRAVDSHIRNLRRKLEDHLPDVTLIHAVYGLGYRYEFADG